MAKPALAVLESALRARKLDRTLTTALPPLERSDPAALAPADLSELDLHLRGGLPRGHVSELTGRAGAPAGGARTAGRTTLLLRLMAAATRRGELAALIDACDRLDVASAIGADVDLDRLLWIRGDGGTAGDGGQTIAAASPSRGYSWSGTPGAAPGTALERSLDRALKALSLVLQAGGFGLVAIDLADVSAAALRRLPFTTWLRLQRIVEGSDTACVLVVPEPIARSAGGLTLTLGGRTTWTGEADLSRRLTGVEVSVHVGSPRRRVSGELTVQCHVRG